MSPKTSVGSKGGVDSWRMGSSLEERDLVVGGSKTGGSSFQNSGITALLTAVSNSEAEKGKPIAFLIERGSFSNR